MASCIFSTREKNELKRALNFRYHMHCVIEGHLGLNHYNLLINLAESSTISALYYEKKTMNSIHLPTFCPQCKKK